MCLSCGCGEADANHGDPRNITTKSMQEAGGIENLSQQMLQDAADSAEIPVEEVMENIKATAK
jgi:hypothetical protein